MAQLAVLATHEGARQSPPLRAQDPPLAKELPGHVVWPPLYIEVVTADGETVTAASLVGARIAQPPAPIRSAA